MEKDTRDILLALGASGLALLASPALVRSLDRESCEPTSRTVDLPAGEYTKVRGVTLEQTKDHKVIASFNDGIYRKNQVRFENTPVIEIPQYFQPDNGYIGSRHSFEIKPGAHINFKGYISGNNYDLNIAQSEGNANNLEIKVACSKK
jgi:hypothetical protein